MTNILSIATDPASARRTAVATLDRGELVAIPTETVYGLAADATNGAAVARIFEAKGRPRFNPLICHMADLAMAERHVAFDPVSRKLAERFWPGPLTLVLPIKPDSTIAALATAGLDTLAVRVPAGFAGGLIASLDRPLAAPSANTSGKLSPTRAEHVADDLGGRVSLILDGGPCSVGLESTIVKVEESGLTLLRPGGLCAEEIEAATGTTLRRRKAGSAIEAPGMMASHYAPAARVRVEAVRVAPGEALVNFGGQRIPGAESACVIHDLSATGDLVEAAAALFDTLKRADSAGASVIAVAPIPTTGLGEAINNRLSRAAAPRDSGSSTQTAHWTT